MSIDVMKLALEAFEVYEQHGFIPRRLTTNAINALRYAIQDQESYAAAYPDNFVKRASEAFEEALERGWKGLAEEGSQVTRVWWDGDKLVMQPVSVNDMYETAPLETQPDNPYKQKDLWHDNQDNK